MLTGEIRPLTAPVVHLFTGALSRTSKKLTENNLDFHRVLYTAKNLQLVLMNCRAR